MSEERAVDRTARVTYRPKAEREELRSFLVVREGRDRGGRLAPGADRAVVGRAPESALVLSDSGVSSRHFAVWLAGGTLWVEDLGSSNGTFVDDRRIAAPTLLPVGATIAIGRTLLRHEVRGAVELERERALDADLERAARYVASRLPPPLADGAVRVDWRYLPSDRIGGDAFTYRWLDGDRFALTLLDVSGHGAPAALHAVAALEALERGRPAGEAAERPAELLGRLNEAFPLAATGLYFTAWHGVFDSRDRTLRFASAGHPAPLLRAPASAPPERLVCRNPPIGMAEGIRFTEAERVIPPASALYLFTDGLFEIVSDEGVDWGPAELAAIVARPRIAGLAEPLRVEADVRAALPGTRFDDDVSLLVAELD